MPPTLTVWFSLVKVENFDFTVWNTLCSLKHQSLLSAWRHHQCNTEGALPWASRVFSCENVCKWRPESCLLSQTPDQTQLHPWCHLLFGRLISSGWICAWLCHWGWTQGCQDWIVPWQKWWWIQRQRQTGSVRRQGTDLDSEENYPHWQWSPGWLSR